jgi:REP element-mobilizing transposase RayT
VDRAAQHLARLSLETDAQAALITRGSQLWAYAGELSRSELDELAGLIATSLDGLENGDLARFIRLRESGGEYMLYSTTLVDDLILSLAFDAATRFSEIRSQAFQLSRALATIPNGEAAGGAPRVLQDPFAEPSPPAPDLPVRPAADFPVWDALEPGGEVAGEGIREADGAGGDDAEQFGEGYSPPATEPVTEALFLDPVSPAIHNISVACVLIPRIPLHRLLGDLKDALELWMPQICLGFGWRLSDLAVHPDRLLWVVNLPPDFSASFMLEAVRRLTSEKIFERNPILKAENPSGDFWAPGYMILASSRLPGDEPVAKYIRRTRSWQGYR